ncbi:MAG: hypothetical protein IKZ34_01705 [Alphaproteobacteria bacterium]|nr:hypothetical protein [Alphaproteobacteria bacterium]
MKKKELKKRVESADSAKKVNALDLSSDQDLTVGLMNLLYIEDFTKTGQLHDMVHELRASLMNKIVKTSDKKYQISEKLLLESMTLIELANKELAAGNNKKVYQIYDEAYGRYSLFWGLNMGLIDLNEV